jgi:hypothetical protein
VIRSHASSVPRAALPAAASVAALVTALVAALLWATGPARADTAPVPPEPVPTVAADVLPTVQINGVVWSQIVVGNRVYATGRFTRARPAGAAAGTSETVRNNILAYDLTTGALITSWAPSLNAQGFTLAASPDGTRIYVGGEFTNVSGVSKLRIAALDATTGAVITSFNARTNTRVRAIATSGSTVYLGGNFSDINGSARSKVGAVAASNGAVTTWNPGANAEVFGLVALSGKVVAGGRFTTFGGRAAYGMGAVNSSTGAGLAWPINSVVRNAGPDAAIYSLSSNGTNVFGTGYVFGGGGNFEGTFNADSNGNIVWVTDCRGDTYSSFPIGGVLYSVGHAHDCRSIGGNPETNPRSYQYARAEQRDQRQRPVREPPGTDAAALAADADRRLLHRDEPGPLVDRGQRELRRHGRRVPARERHRAAGPRAVRPPGDRAEPAGPTGRHAAQADAGQRRRAHAAHLVAGRVGPRQQAAHVPGPARPDGVRRHRRRDAHR